MNLRRETFRGVLWTGGSSLLVAFLNFATVTILANILSPKDFGVMGIVLTVFSFLTLISDVGLGTAVVQVQDLSAVQLSTCYYLSVLQGIFFGAALYCSSIPLAGFFHDGQLVPLIRIASFALIIIGPGLTFRALLQREMKFTRLGVIEVIGAAVYAVVSIVLGVMGFGVYSLLVGFIVRQSAELAALWAVVRYRPVLLFRLSEVRGLLRFGYFVSGDRLLTYCSRNLDNILIGRFLGMEALGYYSLAYQLIFVLTSKISQVVGRVTYPVFSRLQGDDERIQRGYLAMLKYISLLAFPIVMVVCVLAPELINSLYGAKWGPSIVILQILCLMGFIESVGSTVGGVLYAKGRPDISFRYNMINLLSVAAAIAVGLTQGIVGVAAGIALVSLPLGYMWHRKTNALIHLPWKPFFRSMQFSLLVGGLLLIVTIIVKIILQRIFFINGGIEIMLVAGLLACTVYAAVIYFNKSILGEVKQLFSLPLHSQ